MSQLVSDYVISRMQAWNVKRIFGYPGDGINGLMGALNRAKDEVDFIQVRHEEMAAFMACAHAKFTGEVGVCIATSGPGAIHLLNGLYDAKMDHQPVVAVVGQQARAALGGNYQQEVDLCSLFKDVAGNYIHMATVPSQVRHLIDRAFRIAKTERVVTCVVIPNDLQDIKYEEPIHAHGTVHSSIGYSAPRVIPSDNDLRKAAELLNAGKRVAMLIGAGAKDAVKEVKEVAELLGAGVAKALLGRAVLSDDLPYVTGSIGLLGTKPSWEMMTDCDTLLMIGSSFPYAEFLPKEGQARGVQIDLDGKVLGMRYPMEVHLQGDSKESLRALLPYLKRKEDRKWQETIKGNVAQWWKVIEAQSMNTADLINPQNVFWELSKRLPENCIVSADSGSTAAWFARNLRFKEGMMASLSGTLATMCPGMPYTIAAKFAFPDRIPIGIIGDGAMQMLGINDLITVSKYWKRWSNPQFIILVLNNGDLNMVTWEQRVLTGDPKFKASQDLPDFPYADYARMLGLDGIKIEKQEDVPRALDEAMAKQRPVVIEAVTDPSVPMIPPHLTFEQFKNYMSSIIEGDEDRNSVIKQTYKSLLDEYFPAQK